MPAYRELMGILPRPVSRAGAGFLEGEDPLTLEARAWKFQEDYLEAFGSLPPLWRNVPTMDVGPGTAGLEQDAVDEDDDWESPRSSDDDDAGFEPEYWDTGNRD